MDIFILQADAVKQLGEQIGYGNMMCIASELWKVSLKNEGHPTSGAFVPVLQSDIKSGCKTFYEKQFKAYESLLSPQQRPQTQNEALAPDFSGTRATSEL